MIAACVSEGCLCAAGLESVCVSSGGFGSSSAPELCSVLPQPTGDRCSLSRPRRHHISVPPPQPERLQLLCHSSGLIHSSRWPLNRHLFMSHTGDSERVTKLANAIRVRNIEINIGNIEIAHGCVTVEFQIIYYLIYIWLSILIVFTYFQVFSGNFHPKIKLIKTPLNAKIYVRIGLWTNYTKICSARVSRMCLKCNYSHLYLIFIFRSHFNATYFCVSTSQRWFWKKTLL